MLEQARVPGDGVLVVHCGFRVLSRAGLRAEPFIEALIARTGTLLMPAMSWRIVTPEAPDWDERATPSHVGVLAEIFRTRYAERRSIHPTHSVCGVGPDAARLLAGHEQDPTPCSANGPWGRLAGAGAHILLLGTGFETCTALHHPEEVVADRLYLRPPETAGTYRCVARDGTVHRVRFRQHLRLDRDFPQYRARLAAKGQLRAGRAEGAEWLAVAARDLMADAFANLAARPDAHIRQSANLPRGL